MALFLPFLSSLPPVVFIATVCFVIAFMSPLEVCITVAQKYKFLLCMYLDSFVFLESGLLLYCFVPTDYTNNLAIKFFRKLKILVCV